MPPVMFTQTGREDISLYTHIRRNCHRSHQANLHHHPNLREDKLLVLIGIGVITFLGVIMGFPVQIVITILGGIIGVAFYFNH